MAKHGFGKGNTSQHQPPCTPLPALEKARPMHKCTAFGKGLGKLLENSLWERARKAFGKQPLGKGQESFWKTAFGKGLAKLLENSLWERA